jgi:hypothetical protein
LLPSLEKSWLNVNGYWVYSPAGFPSSLLKVIPGFLSSPKANVASEQKQDFTRILAIFSVCVLNQNAQSTLGVL